LRFGSLDLVRGEWRRYTSTLDQNDQNIQDDGTTMDILAVNIQENERREPIPYVTPPGVVREQLNNNNSIIQQNEQSHSLRISGNGLEPNDARAVFKNVSVDMRQFKKLKMFLHAEALVGDGTPLQNDQLLAFIRLGNDFTQNFYEVQIPLKVSPFTARTAS